MDLQRNIIKIFDNCEEAAKSLGISSRCIHHVAHKDSNGQGGTYKTAGGFLWEFVD
jgi:hypothetical protein